MFLVPVSLKLVCECVCVWGGGGGGGRGIAADADPQRKVFSERTFFSHDSRTRETRRALYFFFLLTLSDDFYRLYFTALRKTCKSIITPLDTR